MGAIGFGLTSRQQACLAFLVEAASAGKTPTIQEIADGIGLASKGNAHRLLQNLEERGKIRRLPHKARAIEVVGLAFAEPAPPAFIDTRGWKALWVERDANGNARIEEPR